MDTFLPGGMIYPCLQNWGGVFLGVTTFYFEGTVMVACFIAAVVIILVFAQLQKWYEFNSPALLYLGLVSYIFYLAHRRIGWVICCTIGTHDMMVWIIVTLLVSAVLYKVYYSIKAFDIFQKQKGR